MARKLRRAIVFPLSYRLHKPPVLLPEQESLLTPNADGIPDTRTSHFERSRRTDIQHSIYGKFPAISPLDLGWDDLSVRRPLGRHTNKLLMNRLLHPTSKEPHRIDNMVCFGADPCNRFVLQYDSLLDTVVAEPSAQLVHGFVELHSLTACGQIGNCHTQRAKRTLPMDLIGLVSPIWATGVVFSPFAKP